MKDIDFDELDRAVSSLLNQKDQPSKESAPTPAAAAPAVPATAPAASGASIPVTTASPQTSVPVVDPSTTQPTPGNLPVIESPAPAAAATTVAVQTPAAPAAPPAAASPAPAAVSARPAPAPERPVDKSPAIVNRNGRFMDMVRPKPARQDDVIIDTPKEISVQPITPSDPAVKPEPVPGPNPDVDPVPVSLGSVPAPDPATLAAEPEQEADTESTPAVAGAPAEPTKATSSINADAGTPSSSPSAAEPAAATVAPASTPAVTAAPEQSPFIADAVVEKRPLGAFAEQSAAADDPDAAQKKTNDPADEQLPADPVMAEKKLPPEFDKNLVEVEASDRTDTTEKPAPASQPAPDKPGIDSKKLAAMSIPQQYKTAERDKPAAETPVFDTTQYHAPIPFADQHKGNKGVWILLIVLMLLIIVCLAYWYFFLY